VTSEPQKNCTKNAPGAQEVQKSVWHMQCAQSPLNAGFSLYIYSSSFKAFNLLIQESYDAKRVEYHLEGKTPDLTSMEESH
jgi:hypothetical protein